MASSKRSMIEVAFDVADDSQTNDEIVRNVRSACKKMKVKIVSIDKNSQAGGWPEFTVKVASRAHLVSLMKKVYASKEDVDAFLEWFDDLEK